MIGPGDLAIRDLDDGESAARHWAATMTDADWLAEGKCPECRGEGSVGRGDCLPCGGTGEVVFCAVCGMVIEHGLIIRLGADKLHPACVAAAVEDGAAS
jgi:RecJ-like exonuclease